MKEKLDFLKPNLKEKVIEQASGTLLVAQRYI